jgi:hypothetical protein
MTQSPFDRLDGFLVLHEACHGECQVNVPERSDSIDVFIVTLVCSECGAVFTVEIDQQSQVREVFERAPLAGRTLTDTEIVAELLRDAENFQQLLERNPPARRAFLRNVDKARRRA